MITKPLVIGKNTSDLDCNIIKERAATKIQNEWKFNNEKCNYLILRNLIQFQLERNPKQLLRTINHKEAHLFDKSTKAYIRF